MAAIAFDPLEVTQQLEATGMPRAQAEVVAKGLTSMFIHNFEGLPRFTGYALVTKDYLDTRFSEFELRITGEMNRRFHLVDQRFADLGSRMDLRFARVNLMLGVILVAVAIPALQSLFALV